MRNLCRAMIALAAVAFATPALSQTYPNKPVHVIVPVPPGALTDVIARRIAADAAPLLGNQPWVMENKPGANFIPAAEACRHSRGDGYTLCVFTTSTLTFNPRLIDDLPYDPVKDFKPIINLGQFTGGLVASPKLGVKTIDDLRKLALASPGKMNFGTYGPASSANVFRQYLNDRWGTNIVEVPYKGANELVAALVNNEIQMTWTALGNWADNPGDAKGVIMTMDGAKRSPKIPQVPTYEEAGLGHYPILTWMGLFAPAETPDAVVAQINAAVSKAFSEPKLKEFLTAQLIEPNATTVAQFTANIARESKETAEILTRFNIPKIK